MLFRKIALFAVLVLASPASGAELTVDNKHVFLGETPVTLRVYSKAEGPTFIRVHQNETDAGIVGQRIVTELGGRFIDLVHAGGRIVTFSMQGGQYEFDPNRIFTPEGIVRTVLGSNRRDLVKARSVVATFAQSILSLIGERQPLIALHNNRGGVRVSHYREEGPKYRLGTWAHLGATGESNVVFVTTQDLALFFVRSGVSMIFELDPLDDGSMLVRYRHSGLTYANVETLIGQSDLQMQLARDVARVIGKQPAVLSRPALER